MSNVELVMLALTLGMLLGLLLAFSPYLFIDEEMSSDSLTRYKDF